MNPLAIFARNRIKDRILKNNENVLDVMGKQIVGAKQCPLMMGQKCIGQFCQFFNEYKDIDRSNGKERSYWMCDYNMTPKLLIELNANIREFINAIKRGASDVENKDN